MSSVDLGSSITYTYERDDGMSRSWIDHIICSQSCSSLVSDISVSHCGSNLSDHSPLMFTLCTTVEPFTTPVSPSSCPSKSAFGINWSKVSSTDIDRYCIMVSKHLPSFPQEILNCSIHDCSIHHEVLDSYTHSLISVLDSCSRLCFPSYTHSSASPRLPGWNDGTGKLREISVFWHRVWVEAGCPSPGVPFNIKRKAKTRFKYAVRRLKRRRDFLVREKLACAFTARNKQKFWSEVRHLNHVKKSYAPSIDGISDPPHIADLFSSKFAGILNKHSSPSPNHLLSQIQSSLSSSPSEDLCYTEDDVTEAICRLKSKKSGAGCVTSEHLKFSHTVIALPLSQLFTSILRHGYMPSLLRDSILVPVPKSNKDTAVSSNYRPVALSSTLSKVLEWMILHKYSEFFTSSHLQFGFKPHSSTSLCTGVVKNVVSRYIINGSSVYECFLDASKAFDLVDHSILFHKLLERGLPLLVVRFLLCWYTSQECHVRWGSCLSDSFGVSNSVRQGSVLSPLLFAVYLDGLLSELVECGVGCYWKNLFAGCLCYADDIVLLAPCPSALRIMLNICCKYASCHGLAFNKAKSQLICFRHSARQDNNTAIYMNGHRLHFVDKLSHLGHILTFNLHDKDDIIRATNDLNRKANYILSSFKCVDPSIKCFLLKSFCLSLYGCVLWSLSSPDINIIQVALNHHLRRIWKLPRNSHSAICHCLGQVSAIRNVVLKRFSSFCKSALSSSSPLTVSVFSDSCFLPYTFTGYNNMYGYQHVKLYSDQDVSSAMYICYIHLHFGFNSPFESDVSDLSTS